jgi:hypothetical protein
MPRAQGYATLFDPDCGIKETDTHTCAHCGRVVHTPVNKKIEEVGDFCRNCMKVICLNCAGRGCTPLMKKIERMEERYRARRFY